MSGVACRVSGYDDFLVEDGAIIGSADRRAGLFTLTELLVVIAILAAMLMSAVEQVRKKGMCSASAAVRDRFVCVPFVLPARVCGAGDGAEG